MVQSFLKSEVGPCYTGRNEILCRELDIIVPHRAVELRTRLRPASNIPSPGPFATDRHDRLQILQIRTLNCHSAKSERIKCPRLAVYQKKGWQQPPNPRWAKRFRIAEGSGWAGGHCDCDAFDGTDWWPIRWAKSFMASLNGNRRLSNSTWLLRDADVLVHCNLSV